MIHIKQRKDTGICKISEGNTHELLRYSIGSFVTVLTLHLQKLQLHRNSTTSAQTCLANTIEFSESNEKQLQEEELQTQF